MAIPLAAAAQQSSEKATIQKINAAVAAREENVVGYTATERYRVFRNGDQAHPTAEMTVKTTYRTDTGKSYVILQESGSEILRKEVLERILDSERLMSQPEQRGQAVLTSANYKMTVKGNEVVRGHDCIAVVIVPRKESPYLFKGSIWVDPEDGSIVQLEGVASKSPTILTGASQVSRSYERMDGFPMATRAAATSSSWLLGQTNIDIDYSDYEIQLRPAQQTTSGTNPGTHIE